jgi:tetratricopeptide (TPR) repeat protein
MKIQENLRDADRLKGQCRKQKKFEALFKSGSDYLDQRNYEEALKSFQEAAGLMPDHEGTFFRLGHIYETIGRSGSAKQMYQRVLGIRPENSEAMIRLAQILEKEGDYHQAVCTYQKAIETNPRSPAPRFGLAFLYQHYDMFDEAREVLEALLEQEPLHPLACLYLDGLLGQLGNVSGPSRTTDRKLVLAQFS